jgi:hypothetical protein
MITRENYEEYFLLYVDNELPAAARSAVEQFVAANADLREEFDSLLQCRVDPDQQEVFDNKELLLQQDLVSYIDGELDGEGRRAVEEFVAVYPSKALELQRLSMTVSEPDLAIVHPDKESLYRTERRKVILLPWMQAGIAAAVLGLIALLLFVGRQQPIAPDMAGNRGQANGGNHGNPASTGNQTAKSNPAINSTPANDSNPENTATATNRDTPAKNINLAVTPAKPKPLYSTGSNDQHREPVVAKIDQPKEQYPTKTTARVEQQEVAVTRPSEPVVVVAAHPDQAEDPLMKPATTVAAVNIPKEQSSFATQALLAEAQGDETKEDVAAVPAGRSKLRGLFRRVSRTFGKTAERDDDGQKEVLISAFQVGLK